MSAAKPGRSSRPLSPNRTSWPAAWRMSAQDAAHAAQLAADPTTKDWVLKALPVQHPVVLTALAGRDPAGPVVRKLLSDQLTGGPYLLCPPPEPEFDQRAQIWAQTIAGLAWLTRRRFQLLLSAAGVGLGETADVVLPVLATHRWFTRESAGMLVTAVATFTDADKQLQALSSCGPDWALLAKVFAAALELGHVRSWGPYRTDWQGSLPQVGALLERASGDVLFALPALLRAMPTQSFPDVLTLAQQVSEPARSSLAHG